MCLESILRESDQEVPWDCPLARNIKLNCPLSEVCKTWREPSFHDLFLYVRSIAVGDDLEKFSF